MHRPTTLEMQVQNWGCCALHDQLGATRACRLHNDAGCMQAATAGTNCTLLLTKIRNEPTKSSAQTQERCTYITHESCVMAAWTYVPVHDVRATRCWHMLPNWKVLRILQRRSRWPGSTLLAAASMNGAHEDKGPSSPAPASSHCSDSLFCPANVLPPSASFCVIEAGRF